MFRFEKGDIFPFFLALTSTVLAVSLCFILLTRFDFTKVERKSKSTAESNDAEVKINSEDVIHTINSVVEKPQNEERHQPTALKSTSSANAPIFPLPDLVPQGTTISINGSPEIDRVNRILRKGFHRKFPGTAVNTEAHGEAIALKLLSSGDINLAAIDRALTEEEAAAGLKAIEISNLALDDDTSIWHYVYRSPIDPDVEAFLGYVLSLEVQLTIGDR